MLHQVFRWEARGERGKEFRPLLLWDGQWKWEGHPTPRPLYGLADLAARPDAPVLLNEGEKAVEGARDHLPDYVCMSWSGGTGQVKQADYRPLNGRRCVLWPDNDPKGKEAMEKAAGLLAAAGAAEVRVVSVPEDAPPKFDLGDPLPTGWTEETVERLISEAIVRSHDATAQTLDAAEAPNGGLRIVTYAAARPEIDRATRPALGEWDAGGDDAVPPPRGWLLGNVFCRRFASSLIADGGVGKTAVRMAQLLSLACGRSLTGEHVFQRCRVLPVSLEDDRDELRRRIMAAMLQPRGSSIR